MSSAAMPGAGGWTAAKRPRVGFVALLALVAWAPLPLGSNRAWSEALLAAGFLGLAFLVLLGWLWRGEGPGERVADARWPLALLAASAGFGALQLAALPAPVLDLLSPVALQAWRQAGVDGAASISLDRAATAAEVVHLASLAALFLLTVHWVSSARRVHAACVVVVTIGVLEALGGVALELARASGWLAGRPEEGVGGASGSYVNPNHFAGLLEMALCVSVGLWLAQPGGGLPASTREAVVRALGFVLSPRLLLAGAQLMMLVALVWSGSRGGILALAVGLGVVFVLVLPPRAGAGFALRAGTLAAAAALATAALAVGGSATLGEKLASQGLASNRLLVAADTLAMAADFPLTGAGAGSFASVFPAYKSEQLGLASYQHAHNDLLEAIAETGPAGAALLFGGFLWALVGALVRGRRRRSRGARALTAGCAAAAASLLVHGLYDFNLQIPANVSLFVFVLALAWCAARLPQRPSTEDPHP